MDDRIIDFLSNNHLLSLATSKENIPHACNCYYVYDQTQQVLIFSSDSKTKHVNHFLDNPNVSAAISKDNVEVTIIRSDTKRMERCTPDQLDAVISTLS
jgi:hypothetical protein